MALEWVALECLDLECPDLAPTLQTPKILQETFIYTQREKGWMWTTLTPSTHLVRIRLEVPEEVADAGREAREAQEVREVLGEEAADPGGQEELIGPEEAEEEEEAKKEGLMDIRIQSYLRHTGRAITTIRWTIIVRTIIFNNTLNIISNSNITTVPRHTQAPLERKDSRWNISNIRSSNSNITTRSNKYRNINNNSNITNRFNNNIRSSSNRRKMAEIRFPPPR